VDIWTAEKRSQVMTKVRSRGNLSTEEALAKAFRRLRVTGWRRHLPVKMGDRAVRPDFVFPRAGLVVFVHGCFWHGCPRHGTTPSTRRSYWVPKLAANKTRDRRVERALRKQNWKVLRIWEHSVQRDPDRCVRRIVEALSA
jgi:DNA mismatch endonuclease (patch repair protein)